MDDPSLLRRAQAKDAEGIARVHVASWRSTYQGIVAPEVLDSLSVERRAAYWAGALRADGAPSVHYVAIDPSTGVVGFASGGLERDGIDGFSSELFAIYVLASSQGRGLGKRLVAAVVRDLIDAGHASMLVWVLAANPARHFYTALGGREVASKRVTLGPDELDELAFGWNGLAALATRLRSP